MFLPGISLGQYCQKSPFKSMGFRKNTKRKDGHVGGLCTEGGGGGGGFKPSAYYDIKIKRLKGGTLEP